MEQILDLLKQHPEILGALGGAASSLIYAAWKKWRHETAPSSAQQVQRYVMAALAAAVAGVPAVLAAQGDATKIILALLSAWLVSQATYTTGRMVRDAQAARAEKKGA